MQHILPGSPSQLGATVDADGVNFAVFSANARDVELCLFSQDGTHEEQRLSLPGRSGPIWHGYVPGLAAGALYGFRVDGDYQPESGHRFNKNKLLLDPYTRELYGNWQNHDATLGFDASSTDEDLSFNQDDSAPYMPKSVVSNPEFFTLIDSTAYDHYEYELIYEAHAKGLSMQHPGVPEKLRGTYEGLASDAIIEHLLSLNVTAIELLPIHGFIDDGFLTKRGLRNYWGYNSIAFFAPEPRYFGDKGILGFKQMVQRFKDAGIDVILDVVYNHTAEGDQRGPTLSFRGLDNASYYRLHPEQPRYYVNDTGCGNTLDTAHPMVLRMVLDSLRFWVQCMGVSGFRFDLATALARDEHGYNPRGAFLSAIRQDPVLANVRLIAEPWDLGPGGYQLGGFPHPFSEWNDAYRDSVRKFWRGDTSTAQEMGARLLGSADRFVSSKRPAWASINFLSSHDGFTLADITRYNEKHNYANTENNSDGHDANYSDNCGAEGDTTDVTVIARRKLRQRNMLATLFFSQGVPMLLGGDEISNSQGGNNNAYCQDNEIGWIDWASADADLLDFVKVLSQFRKDHPVVRQVAHLHGDPRDKDALPDIEWTDFSGNAVNWANPDLSRFCVTYRHAVISAGAATDEEDSVQIIVNRHVAPSDVNLPAIEPGQQWLEVINTALPQRSEPISHGGKTLTVQPDSIIALSLVRKP